MKFGPVLDVDCAPEHGVDGVAASIGRSRDGLRDELRILVLVEREGLPEGLLTRAEVLRTDELEVEAPRTVT